MRTNPSHTRTDDNIADRVIEALWQDPFLDASQFTVTVKDGQVTLDGSEIDPDNCARALDTVSGLVCVTELVNNTTPRLRRAA